MIENDAKIIELLNKLQQHYLNYVTHFISILFHIYFEQIQSKKRLILIFYHNIKRRRYNEEKCIKITIDFRVHLNDLQTKKDLLHE